MRIILDVDGTITEGLHVEEPVNPLAAYTDLRPYDANTVEVYNRLCLHHNVTILTSRHQPWALHQLTVWLAMNDLVQPDSIITHCVPERKGAVAKALGAELFVDDSPAACISALAANIETVLCMDNPGWKQNQVYSGRRLFGWAALAAYAPAPQAVCV